MSGGSFEYLYSKEELPEYLLEQMAEWLEEHEMPDAADDTRALIQRPSDELRKLWKAAEWFVSCDWGFEPIMEAYAEHRKTKKR